GFHFCEPRRPGGPRDRLAAGRRLPRAARLAPVHPGEHPPGGGGRARRLRNEDGEVIVERMTAFEDSARHYTYTILEAPFPVRGYLSTLRVHEVPGAPGSAEVEWTGRFVPDGVSEEEAVALFTGIYDEGLTALEAALRA
ncbi:LOW QUALITY PROTEIN: conserved hypothetical protein, partial [Streptomyces sp. SPB074]